MHARITASTHLSHLVQMHILAWASGGHGAVKRRGRHGTTTVNEHVRDRSCGETSHKARDAIQARPKEDVCVLDVVYSAGSDTSDEGSQIETFLTGYGRRRPSLWVHVMLLKRPRLNSVPSWKGIKSAHSTGRPRSTVGGDCARLRVPRGVWQIMSSGETNCPRRKLRVRNIAQTRRPFELSKVVSATFRALIGPSTHHHPPWARTEHGGRPSRFLAGSRTFASSV